MTQTTPDSVGSRLRATRRLHGRTLRDVAMEAEVSESFLSQLERGRASASIASLMRIAEALGLSMSEVFEPPREGPQLLRAADRPELRLVQGTIKWLVTPESASEMEVILARLPPGGATGAEASRHRDAEELVVVLKGAVVVQVGPDRFQLGPGDSISFRSAEPHTVASRNDAEAEVLRISSTPTG
jgi:transcriptional regulator with XRE-family HTH domain